MKYLPITIIALLLSVSSYAQSPTWGYSDNFTYDGAGNRVLRFYDYTIVSKPGTTQEQQTDTLQEHLQTTQITVKAYPNPTSDMLVIENQNWKPANKVKVVIFDIAGKLILAKNFLEAKENISLKNLAPGTYQVNYYLDERLLTNWQIIKF